MGTSPSMIDLSAIKLALMAKTARAQAESLLRADPIAIVGMACRVPGGGNSPEEFWELLRAGGDAIRDVPEDRWNADQWFNADPAEPGKAATKSGGFLERIDGFDAAYFGILPREADRMDPQQRLLLEVAVEAFADAGLPDAQLRGTRTGVFIASYHNDYSQLQYENLESIDARTLTGTLHSVLANRLSFLLDLRGPSVSIDTACSSSLVAIHLACQSLRFGETDVALAGGVSLMITPDLFVSMSKIGFMAPDGRCKTFDARADGFGRGEGCGVIVLKRLADALSAGDRVLALIRGSAVNQDGHSTVLAAPNGLAQRAMIEEALTNAQLSPGRIGFVETHGTGTALGDPIEVEALAATVGRRDASVNPCYLGAAKASIGHLEAAAGVAGIIKTVLSLRHEAIPPQAHFRELNPHISLSGTRLSIPTTLVPWPAGTVPRCAGVSSFGVGGTNAHIIVEEAPNFPLAETSTAADALRLLPLSARSADALRELARAWSDFLPGTAASFADLCYSAAERRSHHDWRMAVTGRSKDELRAGLDAFVRGEAGPKIATGRRGVSAPKVAFVFSGQGPQWYAMGRELLATEPAFSAVMTECDALLLPLSGWSLLAELAASEETSRLDQTEIAQPALFALQVALVALWKSWGVAPDGVVGHSVGEIAALHTAGVLSLADAVRVVWHRARIMQQATGLGRMASVSLTPGEAAEIVAIYRDRLSVGAVNGPRTVVLSGEFEALREVLAVLTLRGVNHKLLPVQYAFHSAQMAPFQRRLADELVGLTGRATGTPVYSTVTGAVATGVEFDASYYGRNVREPVRFASAIDAMSGDGFDVFLEIGPHPVLSPAIAECMPEGDTSVRVLGSLRRNSSERGTMLRSLAELYAAGCDPEWRALEREPGQVVSLPAYPWQRERYWLPSRGRRADIAPGTPSGHPLLGRRISTAGTRVQLFEGGSGETTKWLEDHRIFGSVLLPAAALMDIFMEAATSTLGSEASLSEFVIHRPCVLPEPGLGHARWQTIVTVGPPDRAEIELHERTSDGPDAEWRMVASAVASDDSVHVAAGQGALVVAQEAVVPSAFYDGFAELGVEFGPSFRTLTQIRRSDGIAEGIVEIDAELAPRGEAFVLHPLVVDAAMQLCSAALGGDASGRLPSAIFLPIGAERFRLDRTDASRLRARAKLQTMGAADSLVADITIESLDGIPVAQIAGMRFARMERGAPFGSSGTDDSLFEVRWERAEAHAVPADAQPAAGLWMIFADESGTADAVANELTRFGGTCVLVRRGPALRELEPSLWTVDPADPAQFAAFFEVIGTGSNTRGVLHLWGLDVSQLDRSEPANAAVEDLLATGALLHITQALAMRPAGPSASLWVVTAGAEDAGDGTAVTTPRAAGMRGLASAVAIEHPELSCRVVDLDSSDASVKRLVAELLHPRDANRFALREGTCRIPRLERLSSRALERSGHRNPIDGALRVARAGTFDGLEVAPRAGPQLAPDEVRVRVEAAGVNFRDVLLSLGMYPGSGVELGAECAGVVIECGTGVTEFAVGDRVCGFAPGSMAHEVTVPAAFLIPTPLGLSAESAAALPVAMMTAWYGLFLLAGLKRGERILIHAGTGGVGMAAVQLAVRCGAEVFATAGTPEKRALLLARGVSRAFDSRSVAFSKEILDCTGGAGVDVILNSLSGEFIRAGVDALATSGRFLEIGKRDIWSAEQMAAARPDVRYLPYDLGAEALADHSLLRPMMEQMSTALRDGTLTPLPVRVFPFQRAQDAFRFMAQARHVGKIVLRLPGSSESVPDHAPLVVPNATYLITGGAGALGLQTARWMSDSGATHLVLLGRHAINHAQADALREIESGGVTVRFVCTDVADSERMCDVLREIRTSLPPLRGIVHAAGVVDDGVVIQQDWPRCLAVLRGKAHGAFVLHALTLDVPLDFFILYSAAGLLLGPSGQGPYAAANAELDALALARRAMGLPALSVAWGVWAGGGMAARSGHESWGARGLKPIQAAPGFAALEHLMRAGVAHAAVLPIDWARFLATVPDGLRPSFFGKVASRVGSASRDARTTGAGEFLARLRAAPASARSGVLVDHLRERALHVIGLPPETDFSGRTPLKELGLDSLMAVELRNMLVRSTGRPLSATLLFDYPTLDGLAKYLARTLELDAAPAQPQPTSATAGVAALTDDEAEAQLLAELERGASGVVP